MGLKMTTKMSSEWILRLYTVVALVTMVLLCCVASKQNSSGQADGRRRVVAEVSEG